MRAPDAHRRISRESHPGQGPRITREAHLGRTHAGSRTSLARASHTDHSPAPFHVKRSLRSSAPPDARPDGVPREIPRAPPRRSASHEKPLRLTLAVPEGPPARRPPLAATMARVLRACTHPTRAAEAADNHRRRCGLAPSRGWSPARRVASPAHNPTPVRPPPETRRPLRSARRTPKSGPIRNIEHVAAGRCQRRATCMAHHPAPRARACWRGLRRPCAARLLAPTRGFRQGSSASRLATLSATPSRSSPPTSRAARASRASYPPTHPGFARPRMEASPQQRSPGPTSRPAGPRRNPPHPRSRVPQPRHETARTHARHNRQRTPRCFTALPVRADVARTARPGNGWSAPSSRQRAGPARDVTLAHGSRSPGRAPARRLNPTQRTSAAAHSPALATSALACRADRGGGRAGRPVRLGRAEGKCRPPDLPLAPAGPGPKQVEVTRATHGRRMQSADLPRTAPSRAAHLRGLLPSVDQLPSPRSASKRAGSTTTHPGSQAARSLSPPGALTRAWVTARLPRLRGLQPVRAAARLTVHPTHLRRSRAGLRPLRLVRSRGGLALLPPRRSSDAPPCRRAGLAFPSPLGARRRRRCVDARQVGPVCPRARPPARQQQRGCQGSAPRTRRPRRDDGGIIASRGPRRAASGQHRRAGRARATPGGPTRPRPAPPTAQPARPARRSG
jgi:hypothetical protein